MRRRPRKGHRAQRYRSAAKLGRSRLAREILRSAPPGIRRALGGRAR